MELYKNYPKLCLVWCSVEVALYAGQIFGWSALMYILKEEGFYANVCDDFVVFGNSSVRYGNFVVPFGDNITKQYDTYSVSNSSKTHLYGTILETLNNKDNLGVSPSYHTISVGTGANYTVITNVQEHSEFATRHYSRYCIGQDSRLNIWFSIAVGFSYVMCGFLGPIMRHIGMRYYRLFFIVLYVIGALCIGFASPVIPWLLCPGLCCIGISGMALYATNLQVSFLFVKIQSTITAVLVGLFDVSTVTQQLVKIAYAHNISRRVSFISLAILLVVLGGISTFILLPSTRLDPAWTKKKKESDTGDNASKDEKKGFITKPIYKEKRNESAQTTLCNLIFSSQYILHLYWMAVMALRFVSFIGFLNAWLGSLFVDSAFIEAYYLGVFSYTTMGTVVTAVTAGLLHDSQRWRYSDDNDYRSTHMPIILPLTVTILLSMSCTILTFVTQEWCLYITFIFFTFFRSYVYSYEVTFINDAFPLIHFTELFGLLQMFAGVGSLLQYGLFEWFQAYSFAPSHVNIFLLILEISTLAHPLNIWYQCRNHENNCDTKAPERHRISIEIHPECSNCS